jgi:hypothetical protein
MDSSWIAPIFYYIQALAPSSDLVGPRPSLTVRCGLTCLVKRRRIDFAFTRYLLQRVLTLLGHKKGGGGGVQYSNRR